MNRLAAEKTQRRAEDEGRLEAVRRKIASLLRAIEDGLYQPSMKARMAELEAEKAALEERLASAPARTQDLTRDMPWCVVARASKEPPR